MAPQLRCSLDNVLLDQGNHSSKCQTERIMVWTQAAVSRVKNGKNGFVRVQDPIMGINSDYIKTAVCPLRVSFVGTGNL